MLPTIARWHTRYRVAGEGRIGASRLDNAVRKLAAESYATALDQAFAGDPAVYIVRHVRSELTVINPTMAGENAIANAWGGRACAAVVRMVMQHGDDPSFVMRFENEAAFLAQFLADLLDGVAWDRWYYGAFSAWRGMQIEQVLRASLIEYRDQLPAILRQLAVLGRLQPLLVRMPPEVAREVWHVAVRGEPPETSKEQFRILVWTANALAPGGSTEQELFEAYVASSPKPVDWTPRALADGVMAVLLFLETRRDRNVVIDRTRCREVVAALDWLDRDRLMSAIEQWLDSREPAAVSSEEFRIFVRAAIGIAEALGIEVTTEQEILDAYIATSPKPADWTQPRALAQAVLDVLRFLALNVGRVLQPAAPPGKGGLENPPHALIREVIAPLEWLDREFLAASLDVLAPRPPVATPLQRRINDVLAELAETIAFTNDPERDALALFAALAANHPMLASHGAAPTTIEHFVAERSSPQSNAPVLTIESAFAGVFLLSRAIIETRLTRLAELFGLPVPALLLALAAEWHADPHDPGIAFWSGCESQPEPLDPAAHEALRAEIVRFMRDRATFAPSLTPDEDAPLSAHLLRLWVHWLPGFGQSRGEWLLEQVILRRGVLRIDAGTIAVSLCPAPLDVVVEMAGYFAPIVEVPWLGDRRITFSIDRSLA